MGGPWVAHHSYLGVVMGRVIVIFCIIAVSLFMWIDASSYPRAARRLPQLLAGIVILLGLIAAVQTMLKLRGQSRNDNRPLLALPDGRSLAIGALFVGLVIVYIWSIPVLGYLLATALMLFLPLAALRPVGWTFIVATVVIVTGVIWFLFVWFLRLPIPLYPYF